MMRLYPEYVNTMRMLYKISFVEGNACGYIGQWNLEKNDFSLVHSPQLTHYEYFRAIEVCVGLPGTWKWA